MKITNHLQGGGSTLAKDVREGLRGPFKELPPKHLYDHRGLDLFERICGLPEYYQTRTERFILEVQGGRVAALARASELLELGAGSARKTVLLADALQGEGTLHRYVPVDLTQEAVAQAAQRLGHRYPHLELEGVVADLEHQLHLLPPPRGRRLVAFLGSTIGNLRPTARLAFLRSARGLLGQGGRLLVGYDLLKDPRTLIAAYDDRAGVTAAFNRNLLHVINRELGANFKPERFAHIARFDPNQGWIEMRLRSLAEQQVRIPALGLEVRFAAGEEIRTEISAKFSRRQVIDELRAAALQPLAWLTDPRRRFALVLAAPR